MLLPSRVTRQTTATKTTATTNWAIGAIINLSPSIVLINNRSHDSVARCIRMNSDNKSPIGNVSTYTYHNPQGKTSEVLLIPLSREELGADNSFPPPTLMENNLSNWVRSGYFFMDNDVIAQLPRNAEDLPLDQNASQVTDVVHQAGNIKAYYPVNREQAVCITWDYLLDEWTAEYEECSLQDAGIAPSFFGDDASMVWSIDPEKYTD